VDTPDKIVYGLTARQLAILTVAGLAAFGLFRLLGHRLPAPVLIAVLIPVAGVATVLALGRRDGLPMDAWLLAGIRSTRTPNHRIPSVGDQPTPVPGWAPTQPAARLGVLRLPAQAISEAGVINTGDRAVALVAATTVNIDLRTGDEQAALIGAYGRWLNSLSGPVQIVVSAQRVDLSSHAQRITGNAEHITNPALVEVARDYADFLDDLAIRRDPLWRTVTIAVAATGSRAGTEATRRAEQTATALTALGAQTAVLDGGRATAVLATATDPYTPADTSWPRTPPGTVVTGGPR
jgi:hypothetical protein